MKIISTITAIFIITYLILGCASETKIKVKEIEEQTEIEIAELEKEKEIFEARSKIRPIWTYRRPHLTDIEVIEGVGTSDPKPSLPTMRQLAMDNVIAEISNSKEVADTSYIENYLIDFEEHYSSLGKSRSSREALQLLVRKNILRKIVFAKEWKDPETGEYWRYGYMPVASAELASIEAAKEQATTKEGILLDVRKEEFLKKMDERIRHLREKEEIQKEDIEKKLKENMQK